LISVITVFTTLYFTIAFFLILDHKEGESVNPLDNSDNIIIENDQLLLKLQMKNEKIQT